MLPWTGKLIFFTLSKVIENLLLLFRTDYDLHFYPFLCIFQYKIFHVGLFLLDNHAGLFIFTYLICYVHFLHSLFGALSRHCRHLLSTTSSLFWVYCSSFYYTCSELLLLNSPDSFNSVIKTIQGSSTVKLSIVSFVFLVITILQIRIFGVGKFYPQISYPPVTMF